MSRRRPCSREHSWLGVSAEMLFCSCRTNMPAPGHFGAPTCRHCAICNAPHHHRRRRHWYPRHPVPPFITVLTLCASAPTRGSPSPPMPCSACSSSGSLPQCAFHASAPRNLPYLASKEQTLVERGERSLRVSLKVPLFSAPPPPAHAQGEFFILPPSSPNAVGGGLLTIQTRTHVQRTHARKSQVFLSFHLTLCLSLF